MSSYRAVRIPWDGEPELVTIQRDSSELPYLQEQVGGYIEGIYSADMDTVFFAHDEAKFQEGWRYRINTAATRLWWTLNPVMVNRDVIVGTCIVAGPADKNGDTTDVNPAIIKALGLDK